MAALGDGGAGAQDGHVELAGREGLAGAVELVERDIGRDQADQAAAVDELAGGDLNAIGGGSGGGDLEAADEGAVAVVAQAGDDARAGAGGHRLGVLGGDNERAGGGAKMRTLLRLFRWKMRSRVRILPWDRKD